MKSLALSRRSKAATPILVLLTLVVIAAIYVVAASATNARAIADEEQSQTLAAQIEAGHQLFLEGCSSCHGISAQGGPNAPALTGVGSATVDFQLSTGRMPLAQPGQQAPTKPVSYSDEEIAQIAAFIASLGPGPAIPTEEQANPALGDIARGGELFRTNCSQCHNFAGMGGALSDGSYAPDLRSATPVQIYEAMITGPENMPVFSDATLTPQDKRDIIAYIQMFDTYPNYGGYNLGSLGPVTEGLAVYLLIFGGCIAVAVWIGVRVR